MLLLVLNEMKKYKSGQQAEIIGEITDAHPTKVVMETQLGTLRVLQNVRRGAFCPGFASIISSFPAII